MSTTAPTSHAERLALFYREYVGKKIAMALSGVVLFGFVIGHMAGNLQIFLGREKINAYAETLHSNAALLWGVRGVLLLAVVVHAYTGIWLWKQSRDARPQRYHKPGQRYPNLAGRTMALSGIVIGAFVVFHLLHLTAGTFNPTLPFADLRPYENMVAGFRFPLVALFYVVAVLMLGLHLYHGAWSMFQSVGISHPRYTPTIKRLAVLFAFVLAVGFAAVPLAVMLGLVG